MPRQLTDQEMEQLLQEIKEVVEREKQELEAEAGGAEARPARKTPVEYKAPQEVEELDKVKFAKYGEVYEAKVIRIRRGRIADFYNIEDIEDPQIRERLEAIANEPALEIWFDVKELGMRARDVIRVTYHEKSRLAMLARCYREIKLGDTVYVELTPKGKLQIVCPPRE